MLWQNINYCLVKNIFVIGRIIYCWCLKVLYCQFKNIIIIDMSKLLQLLLLANWHFLHKSIFMILLLAHLYECIQVYIPVWRVFIYFVQNNILRNKNRHSCFKICLRHFKLSHELYVLFSCAIYRYRSGQLYNHSIYVSYYLHRCKCDLQCCSIFLINFLIYVEMQ